MRTRALAGAALLLAVLAPTAEAGENIRFTTARAGEAKLAFTASVPGEPTWSIQRDDPAATTVELPPGTTADDVEAIKAVAVPVGTPPADWRIDVTSLNRGFFLGAYYLPGPSFIQWRGTASLTPGSPEAVIWRPTAASP
jgi:hypothetical protein